MKSKDNNEEQNMQDVEDVAEETQEVQESDISAKDEVDYKDKYLRLLAEYSNSLKQKDAELKSMAQFGNKNLLIKFIDIVDDVETGLMQEGLNEETKNILQILQSKMNHLLSLEGVAEISVLQGDDYDSTKCEVITMMEDEANKGKISQIVRKGYIIGDKVLRTAKVIIGK